MVPDKIATRSVKARIVRALLGDRPVVIFLLVSPTLLAILLDFMLRARSLLDFPPKEILNYVGSSLAACGVWGGSLWLISRLFLVSGALRSVARAGLAVYFGGLFFPLAFFAFGGQALYYGIYHAYMGRESVRLGIALRGTVGAWLAAWGAAVVLMALAGVVITVAAAFFARRAAGPLRAAWPILPVLGLGGALYCFWIDFVESRSLQAAPPDTCFIHSAMTALRFRVTHKDGSPKGFALRSPSPLPSLTPALHRPNVLVILSESLRADALCSQPGLCRAQFLDAAAPDRLALGRLTSQASGTFGACMMLWTGLPPDVDIHTAHRAPVLWELAAAAGYRTAYITSQNLRYDDMAVFVQRAGIDVQESAVDLGDTHDPHVGAPDERATARMLAFVREAPKERPYFALLHFSNTHWPYRVDPALQPFAPHSADPFGNADALHNHYRNSALMQERTLARFIADLRAMPRWEDTVVVFLADHGEQFREHGGLYHSNTLFDEEVRVPGWLLAGPRALSDDQRAAVVAYARRRTFSQDMQATIVDLLGVFDQRGALPFAELTTGRSLLRAPSAEEPEVLLSTTSGVWEDDNPNYGVMRGEELLVGAESHTWWCYKMKTDPEQFSALAADDCGPLLATAKRHFPGKVPAP